MSSKTLLQSLKKSARQNGTKIQSSEAEKLEKILNNLFYLPCDIERETEFIHQVMTRGGDTQERYGLHASALLVSDTQYCERQQVLSLLYKQLQGEQINPSLMRIFAEGNAVHEKWQRMFLRAGYSEPDDLDFTRFSDRYQISFSPDIICTIPEFYSGPMVGEIKSVNTHQFAKMINHPSAWKQCQFYMYLTGIKKGFVLCEDKNTQEFKLEVYDFDMSKIAQYIDRAEEVRAAYERLLDTRKMVPRPKDATGPTCKRCETCPMNPACYNVGIGRVRIKTGC